MITIDQLLESVDLDFEPRWVTKDENGLVEFWEFEPRKVANGTWCNSGWRTCIGCLKLSEFDGKDWQECIYEVSRKTTGKIEKVEGYTTDKILAKVNELVDAVNELKGAKNE